MQEMTQSQMDLIEGLHKTREATNEEWENMKRKAFAEAKGVPGQKKFKERDRRFTPPKKKRK